MRIFYRSIPLLIREKHFGDPQKNLRIIIFLSFINHKAKQKLKSLYIRNFRFLILKFVIIGDNNSSDNRYFLI